MRFRRFLPRPHQVVLAIGALAAIGTLASGIAPEITEWHDNSSIAREVFINIPKPLEAAFYLAVATGLFLTAVDGNTGYQYSGSPSATAM